MSGHSKFANIAHKKAANDAQRERFLQDLVKKSWLL